MEFSREGLVEYEETVRSYMVDLQEASETIARHKKSDTIAAFHVQLATDALGSGKSEVIERLREIGILVIGAGLGFLTVMITTSSYTPKNWLLTFIPLLLGGSAYFYCWGRAS